jgi:hypothetical protein
LLIITPDWLENRPGKWLHSGMTLQEHNFTWAGVAAIGVVALLVEFMLAPNSLSKIIVSIGCIVLISFAIYQINRRRRRH